MTGRQAEGADALRERGCHPGHHAVDEGPLRSAPGERRRHRRPAADLTRAARDPERQPGHRPEESRSLAAGDVDVDPAPDVLRRLRGAAEVLGLLPPPPFAVAAAIYRQNLATFRLPHGRRAGLHPRRATPTSPSSCPSRPSRTTWPCSRALAGGAAEPAPGRLPADDRLPQPDLLARDAPPCWPTCRPRPLVSGASSLLPARWATPSRPPPRPPPQGSPEREFAARWDRGDDFEAAFNGELDRYYPAVTARLLHPGRLRRLRAPGRVPPRPGAGHADLREPAAVRPHRHPVSDPRMRADGTVGEV